MDETSGSSMDWTTVGEPPDGYEHGGGAMTRTLTGVLALVSLLFLGTAAQAGELMLPFHATLQVVQDCASSPDSGLCGHFPDWQATCQAQNYDGAFQVVRTGNADYMGRVTSFEQGCLHYSGPGSIVRSYVQLTITAHNGDTLSSYTSCMFDFAQAGAPGNGTFSITGGTGRFAGARGSGTFGQVASEGGPGWIVYQDGFLRLPGGKR